MASRRGGAAFDSDHLAVGVEVEHFAYPVLIGPRGAPLLGVVVDQSVCLLDWVDSVPRAEEGESAGSGTTPLALAMSLNES
jgi:hypothetical protein